MKPYSDRRRDYATKGICIVCNCRPGDSGFVTCGICRERSNAWKRRYISQRLSEKRCADCGDQLPEGTRRTCEPCASRRRQYASNHKVDRAIYNRQRRIDDFSAVLIHYGMVCACCGESERAFLTADHINNDGAKHRRSINRRPLYRWLVKNQFPAGFQILCWNCNCAKGRIGHCPHQQPTVQLRRVG